MQALFFLPLAASCNTRLRNYFSHLFESSINSNSHVNNESSSVAQFELLIMHPVAENWHSIF